MVLHIDVSVHLFRSFLLSHLQMLVLSCSSIFLSYCSCTVSIFELLNFCFPSCFLSNFDCVTFSLDIVLLFLAVTMESSIYCLTCHPRFFLIGNTGPTAYQVSSSLVFRYMQSINIDFKVQFLVHYHHFPSFAFRFLCPSSNTCAYCSKETAYVFTAPIFFFQLSLLFTVDLMLLGVFSSKAFLHLTLFNFIILQNAQLLTSIHHNTLNSLASDESILPFLNSKFRLDIFTEYLHS